MSIFFLYPRQLLGAMATDTDCLIITTLLISPMFVDIIGSKECFLKIGSMYYLPLIKTVYSVETMQLIFHFLFYVRF